MSWVLFFGIGAAVGTGIARIVVMCATELVDVVVGIRRPWIL